MATRSDSVLARLDPETTLFIVASKSFSTTETKVNAASVRELVPRTHGTHRRNSTTLRRHNLQYASRCAEFGIATGKCVRNVGLGRRAIFIVVGRRTSDRAGRLARPRFEELLAGAHVDGQHARTAPIERNLPALLALVGIWNFNMLGAQSHAVLTYDRRCGCCLRTCSNSKWRATASRRASTAATSICMTMPVLWGGEETNGQHAFHQQLHQGNRAFSVDFLAMSNPVRMHFGAPSWLLANYLAQSEALLRGRKVEVPRRRRIGCPSITIRQSSVDDDSAR